MTAACATTTVRRVRTVTSIGLPATWDDFADLVEENHGVWGGCWCMCFHAEGLSRTSADDNRAAKQALVNAGSVHQVLVHQDDRCVGWCQYGSPAELPIIKNPFAELGFRRDRQIAKWRWVMRLQLGAT